MSEQVRDPEMEFRAVQLKVVAAVAVHQPVVIAQSEPERAFLVHIGNATRKH